jgi:hypothetical protein
LRGSVGSSALRVVGALERAKRRFARAGNATPMCALGTARPDLRPDLDMKIAVISLPALSQYGWLFSHLPSPEGQEV